MTSGHKVLATLALMSLCFSAQGQSGFTENSRFSADGLKFEYPKGWSITDEGTTEKQQIKLTLPGNSVQLMVIARRDFTLQKDLPAAMQSLTDALIQKALLALGGNRKSAARNPIMRPVGSVKAYGIRLQTSDQNRVRIAEVIWLRTRLRLVGLVFVGQVSDEASASAIWEIIRGSLSVDPPVLGAAIANPDEPDNSSITSGVLNGKALDLPKPPYSSLARAARVSGEVQVQVIIDEFGNVISAHAISGHPLLQTASVQAARQAKFSPTKLDGEPVRVIGLNRET